MLKKFIQKILSLSLAVLVVANLGMAEDSQVIVKDTTYLKAINYVIEEGFFQGYPDGSFKENQTINRAELLKIFMLGSEIELNNKAKACFNDMQDSDWYVPYVCTAKEMGVVEGYPDGGFKAGNEVNLAEALKMLLLINEIEYTEKEDEAWYAGSFAQSKAMNILPNSEIQPADKLSRGESAELIARFFNYQKASLDEYLNLSTEVEVQFTESINLFDPLSAAIQNQIESKESLILDVPFTSQAPTKDWTLPYSEACEEAALIMVDFFDTQEHLSVEVADALIQDIVKWEEEREYIIDISTQEMAEVAKDYLEKISAIYSNDEVTIENIEHLLNAGYPVIIPIAGQEIGNPYYLGAGPPYHVVVIVGYDSENFVINDPGTQFGENLRFPKEVIIDGIHNWAGSKSNVLDGEKAMLVLSRS